MKVVDESSRYSIFPGSQDPQLRADISIVPGCTLDRTTGAWHVPKTQKKAVRALEMRHTPRAIPVPQHDVPLYPHQLEGLRFATTHPSLLLDMYMATGKTRLAIELIQMFGAKRVLVAGPSAAGQWASIWRDQLQEHARFKYNLVLLSGEGKQQLVKHRADVLDEVMHAVNAQQVLVVVVNYEAAWRHPLSTAILAHTWDMVIADECHRLKSPGSKVSRFFGRLARAIPFRVGLSGTPTPHSILDAYALYRFLHPAIFGTNFNKFKARYTIENPYTHQVEDFIRVEEFRAKFNLIRYHVGREALQLDQPVFAPLPVRLAHKVWKVYTQVEQEFFSELDAERSVDAPNVMVKYLRLQQIESGFVRDDNGDWTDLDGGSVKMDALTTFLEDFPRDEKLVVFTRFRREATQVESAARAASHKFFRLIGGCNELAAWQRERGGVLAVALGAGSEAINLTAASYAVFYSLGPKLSEWEQAIARLNRPGQRSAPMIYVMHAEGPKGEVTLGRRVFNGLKARRNLLNYLLEGKEKA